MIFKLHERLWHVSFSFMPRALFIARTSSCWWDDDVYTLVSPHSYRQSKFSVVHKEKTNQGSEVTGLALSVVQKSQLLFITTRESLIMYDISVKDKNTPVCTISNQISKHSCMYDIPSGIKHSSALLVCYCYPYKKLLRHWLHSEVAVFILPPYKVNGAKEYENSNHRAP